MSNARSWRGIGGISLVSRRNGSREVLQNEQPLLSELEAWSSGVFSDQRTETGPKRSIVLVSRSSLSDMNGRLPYKENPRFIWFKEGIQIRSLMFSGFDLSFRLFLFGGFPTTMVNLKIPVCLGLVRMLKDCLARSWNSHQTDSC